MILTITVCMILLLITVIIIYHYPDQIPESLVKTLYDILLFMVGVISGYMSHDVYRGKSRIDDLEDK